MSVLAGWLGAQAPGYAQRHVVSGPQQRALQAIRDCRTPVMGGRVYRCGQCSRTDFAYHSCHHRACPRCGGNRTAAWTLRQTERLLPVPYFMATFTVPAALRPVFLREPKIMIDRLFQEAAGALQEVAAMPRHLGAELGMIGVLHTWGRQMQYHPHVHFIVPGGGLRAEGCKWRKTRKPDWLVPGEPVAARFRRRMEAALRAALPREHAGIASSCWPQKWVVDLQCVGRGETAVKYLARYVSRTAISDERIITMTPEQVRFGYRDSRTSEARECALTADEFMRRYLQHVLPAGLHRVRYFGWEHPASHRRRRKVETLLEVVIVVRAPEVSIQWHLRCPHCEAFALVCIRSLARRPRAPPERRAA